MPDGWEVVLADSGSSGFTCTREGRTLSVVPYGPNVIRVRFADGPVRDLPWTILPPKEGPSSVRMNEETGETAVVSGSLKAVISGDRRIVFRDSENRLLLEERHPGDRNLPARSLRGFSGELFRAEQVFAHQDGEHFYGLGQDPTDLFDLAGAVLDLCQQNTKSTIPFVVSSRGYGFVWNNPAVGRVEFATTGTRWTAERTKQIDYFVIGGNGIPDVMRRYADLTGHAPAFPEWAAGLWQSKLRYETQEQLLAVAREYHRRGIPLSMIVCDYFHWPQQGEWKFDRKYWPDPEAMVRELKEMGIHLLVSIWPTVDPRSENFEEMKNRGLLVRPERGSGFMMFCRGPEIYYDTTNPEARQFVWDTVRKNYWSCGIRNFWLDEAEPEMDPYDYDNVRYCAGPGMEVSSIYPWYYAKNFYDGEKAEGQDEIVNLIRCAFLGSQRFGVVLWSGDIASDFDSLRRQIKVGQHVAMSGIPWWTTDIGGFHGGDPDDPGYRECFVRWLQFGAFCPVFRIHGFRTKKDRRIPDDPMSTWCPSGGPNEIWSYGEEAYLILKSFVMLRERLRPYIMEQMNRASMEGTPVMRPMFYDFPEEPFYGIWDQYMFGPDLIVCPVCEAGQRSRSVRLPKGKWIDAWDGREYTGGQTITADAPLTRIPLFLREGGFLSPELFCGE